MDLILNQFSYSGVNPKTFLRELTWQILKNLQKVWCDISGRGLVELELTRYNKKSATLRDHQPSFKQNRRESSY